MQLHHSREPAAVLVCKRRALCSDHTLNLQCLAALCGLLGSRCLTLSVLSAIDSELAVEQSAGSIRAVRRQAVASSASQKFANVIEKIRDIDIIMRYVQEEAAERKGPVGDGALDGKQCTQTHACTEWHNRDTPRIEGDKTKRRQMRIAGAKALSPHLHANSLSLKLQPATRMKRQL